MILTNVVDVSACGPSGTVQIFFLPNILHTYIGWIAQWFKSLAVEPEVGSSIPRCVSWTGAGCDDLSGPFQLRSSMMIIIIIINTRRISSSYNPNGFSAFPPLS